MERVIAAVIVLAAGLVVGAVMKDRNGTKKSFKIPAILGALAAALLFASACFTSVPTGHTGVVTTFGRVENFTLDAGIHAKLPWQKVINLDNRGIDAPTDVLSFPMVDYTTPADFSHLEEDSEDYFNFDTGELMLGDIVVSLEKVREQATAYGHSETRELGFLIAHSMLHLFGYDHIDEAERAKMEDRQREILDGLGIHR